MNRVKIYNNHLQFLGKSKFTLREIDIISAILHNRGEKKIALLLSISPRTVSVHVHNIMLKLGCNSKDGIIDSIEKSDRRSYFEYYYRLILVENAFKEQLSLIKKELGSTSVNVKIIFPNDISKTLLQAINRDLTYAGIKIDYSDLTTHVLTIKHEILDLMEENYFKGLTELLKEITGDNKLEVIYQNLDNKINDLSLNTENKIISPAPKKTTPIIEYVAITISILISIFILTGIYYKNSKPSILTQSDLVIPNSNILLERGKLHQAIASKINSQNNNIPIVVLVGIGGCGKTTLARHYAKSHKSNIIWEINADNNSNLLASFENLALSLAASKNERDELVTWLKACNLDEKIHKVKLFLSNKLRNSPNWLLIYNNVENFEKIAEYLPHDKKMWGSGAVILTTRNSNVEVNDYISSENIINIGELTKEEKLQLFTSIVGKISSADRSHLENLIDKLPSFPLDVSHAAHYIKIEKVPYSKYIEYITSKKEIISNLTHECLKDNPSYEASRHKIIIKSLDQIIALDPSFKDLLMLISLLRYQDLPKDLLIYYKGDITTQKFIKVLRKFSFITSNDSLPESFSMHSCIQEIALGYLNSLKKDDQYVSSVKSIAKLLDEYLSSKLETSEICTLKLLNPHVMEFVSGQNTLSEIEKAQLYYHLGLSYFHIGNYTKSKTILESVEKIYMKYSPQYNIEIAKVMVKLAILERNMGDYEKAKLLLEEALAVYKKNYGENHIETAKISIYLGSIYRNFKDYTSALKLTLDGLKIYTNQLPEDSIELAWANAYLGAILTNTEDYKKAEDLLENALSIYQNYYKEPNTKTAWVKVRLGILYYNINKHHQAQKLIKEALNIYKLYNGDSSLEYAWCLTHLGIIYRNTGNYKQSKNLLYKALNIFTTHLKPDHQIMNWVKENYKKCFI